MNVRECPSVLGALQVRPLLPEVANYLRLLQCGFEGFNPKVCCPPVLDLNQSNRPSTKVFTYILYRHIYIPIGEKWYERAVFIDSVVFE